VEAVENIVIGAGAVGLAAAADLAETGNEVVVVEAETRAGSHTSTRNSGVIHAGLYYKPGSLKASLCVEGKELLYRFCDEYGVPYRRIGKLVVAVDEAEQAKLADIIATAHKNGVTDLEWQAAEAVREREPDIRCVAAFYSPSTGIIDPAAYVSALEVRLDAASGVVAFDTAVTHIEPAPNGFVVTTNTGERLLAKRLVNAAGLGAVSLAKKITGYPVDLLPNLKMARGNYFTLRGACPFSTLVYPVPIPGGLGVHVTLDMAGGVRFGPDVQMVDAVDYTPDPSREQAFRQAIARYYPGIVGREVAVDYTGIRPQIGPLGQFNDFSIQGPAHHGLPGLVNVMGIESPGLTSSLALARYIVSLL
jgi:L-2-hydroxyglutarate oxidase LhgO